MYGRYAQNIEFGCVQSEQLRTIDFMTAHWAHYLTIRDGKVFQPYHYKSWDSLELFTIFQVKRPQTIEWE